MVSALRRMLFRDLRHMLGQSVTIALVVASGIASYVAMQSAYASLVASQQLFYAEARFADAFVSLDRAPEAVGERLEAISGVATAETRVVQVGRLRLPDVSPPPIAHLVSLPPERAPALNDVTLTDGRRPGPDHPQEALLSTKFAEREGIETGQTVEVLVEGQSLEVTVTGLATSPEFIYPLPPGGLPGEEDRVAVLWMPRPTLARATGMEGAFNDAAFRLAPQAHVPAVLEAIDREFERYGGLGAYERARQTSHEFLSMEIEQLRASATVIPVIFLGVAAFLVNVVLSRLVMVQRGVIASLQAFGYGRGRIALYYVELVGVMAVGGAMLGLAGGSWLGHALNELYAEIFGLPVLTWVLPLPVFLVAVGVSWLAAGVGAIWAVRSVLRLSPAEAMQPPAPPAYRPSVLDRLRIQRWFQASARMIVRELERRPLRTLLSATGIALAVATLIVGRFFIDAVDHLIDVEFHQAMREDAVVAFARPRGEDARHALERLPGVTRTESLRMVPVRLEVGHRQRDVALQGHPDPSVFRSVVDQWGTSMPIPEEGVLLTRALADALDVRVGQTVRAEVLQGDRRTLMLQVTGTVDEMIGTQGYLHRDTLARILGEGPQADQVLLQLDPAEREAVMARLEDMPDVVAVTLHEDTLAAIREQMDETIVFMTVLLTVFAASIAVGVVYNDARVALSMRARELATLRVLGMTRGEVSGVLLGELGVRVLLGLPFGILLGMWFAEQVTALVDPELFRLPAVISAQTIAFAVGVVILATAGSALLVRRRIDRLDLVEVLKTRE